MVQGGECFNGKAAKIALPLKAATLPSKVIVTIAFNTSNYGTSPTKCNEVPNANCPEDSLNVGVNDGFEEAEPQTVRRRAAAAGRSVHKRCA